METTTAIGFLLICIAILFALLIFYNNSIIGKAIYIVLTFVFGSVGYLLQADQTDMIFNYISWETIEALQNTVCEVIDIACDFVSNISKIGNTTIREKK